MKNFYSNTLKLIQIANIGIKNNPDYVYKQQKIKVKQFDERH